MWVGCFLQGKEFSIKPRSGLLVFYNVTSSKTLQYFGDFFGVNFAVDSGDETGMKLIADIKTLDTGIIGAIFISAIIVFPEQQDQPITVTEQEIAAREPIELG